jgi:RTX calcium-binding nonapeptide repeat (4 copies)
MAMLLALASTARSGTVAVTTDEASATLSYRAAPGERNSLVVALVDGEYTVEDVAGVVPGAGCRGDPLAPQRVNCTLPAGLSHQGRVYLGDGNDSAYLRHVGGLAFSLFGGSGSDSLSAPGSGLGGIPLWLVGAAAVDKPLPGPGSGASSPPGSSLSGGPGDDRLYGGDDDEVLIPGVGRDFVETSRGSDRVVARDGLPDDIRCRAGARVVADRRDFVWGRRCGAVRRPGAVVAVPLGVWNEYSFGYIMQTFVGCPSDSQSACRGKLTLAIRGGRRLVQRRFRIVPGVPKPIELYVSDAAGAALERRDALVTVESVDSAGRMRTISRVFDVSPLPEGE